MSILATSMCMYVQVLRVYFVCVEVELSFMPMLMDETMKALDKRVLARAMVDGKNSTKPCTSTFYSSHFFHSDYS